jgi:Sec-independent protein secretion pathway component TatC
MLGIKIYRILTFILLPIEIIMGLMALIMLIMSLGNVGALLPVFMISCTVIYIFSSFRFLNSGIEQHKPLKASLKHWIKVNGYVCIGFCILMITQIITLLVHPEVMQEMYQQLMVMQNKMQGQQLSAQLFKNMMIGMFCGMLAYAVLLLVHSFMSFRFVQQYQHLFDED